MSEGGLARPTARETQRADAPYARLTPIALWRLARPRGMLLVLSMPTLGYGFGLWEWARPLVDPQGMLLVLAAWWFLSAGTLWLNAAFDRDEGEVLMETPRDPTAKAPAPPDPDALWRAGLLALAVCVMLLSAVGWAVTALGAACALLAIAYSHPATAWKAHPVLGPVVNIAGYGLLSPLAGWVVTASEPTPRTALAALLVATWVGGAYFGAQAFQHDEDARRGYRTLVVTHGPLVTLQVTRALFGLALWGFVLASIFGLFPRLCIAALLPWYELDRHLSRWARGERQGIEAARGMLRRGVVVGLSVMTLVTAHHLWQLAHRRPPAGMGTAWNPVSVEEVRGPDDS